MATFRRMLKDDDNNNVLPVTGYNDNYSTTEIDTGYTWINGKRIYKKTIYIASLPNSPSGSYDHNISNFDSLVKWEGFTILSGNPVFRPLPFTNTSTNTNYTLVEFDSTKIYIYCGSDRRSYSAYITIYYTKTS